MDAERLKRIRNYQSTDWYPAIVMRPLTILVMLVIADWRFVTPNRLTHLGNLSKLAAAALIVPDEFTTTVIAVVLLQLGVLFDHLDGTLARYRRAWSSFGSFYDKVSDAITWFPIVMAVGWVAYQRSGDNLMLVLAAVHTYAMLTLGYLKWVAYAETQRLDWFRVRDGDSSPIERNTRAPKLSEPPARTVGQWIKWFAWSMAQIVRFEEMDLFFWVGVGLLFGHLDILLWILAATQVGGVLVMVVKRGRDVARADREIAEHRRSAS
jgi:phosphatidylglycerophosphate synthase